MYTIYTSCSLYIVICEGATDYAYAVSWMCFCIADVLVQCVRVVQLNGVKVQCMACCGSGSVM